MAPEIIIDAYNLIHRVGDLRIHLQQNLENARERLLQKLIVFRQNKKIKITVVFDGDQVGQPSSVTRNGLQIYYSIPPRNADETIKILLRKRKNPRNITVVSSDNEILNFARTNRAITMRSEEFYQKFLRVEQTKNAEDTKPEMTEKELQNWLNMFNQAEDR
ncbi:MAG TPA: hypothetical protein ENH29_04295 [Bacteroidetes bacterium]|nr:hypothetical protein [Bacteroidota bacterium]